MLPQSFALPVLDCRCGLHQLQRLLLWSFDIKFQTFKPEKLVSKYAQKADYQKKTTGSQESQLQMLGKLALSYDDFVELKKHCEQIGIGFLSTPFDEDSIRFLDSLDMDFWKIPSDTIFPKPIYSPCR